MDTDRGPCQPDPRRAGDGAGLSPRRNATDPEALAIAPYEEFDLEEARVDDYVLNRARLYRDRRDFVIQPGDTGKPEDYPISPAHPAGG